ncbi:hypothetical protein IQ231_00655 [Cuspidothrix issatschenkoi LEGE 03284]|uniref:hypothetical protein n=1 Tax=Cuspidothrix issatschenkoi TaxID=230752 RepID=UPI00187E9A16|nr:hypothetical protein [Cuspidothrix issatschenkoi]MBE9230245.1 hypothetical protein [Cuspidothrix issatschenkoi LEGE 03284]
MMGWLSRGVAKNFDSVTKEGMKESTHNINRRMFLNLMASGVMVYLTKDLIYPEIASANDDFINEKYHVFIPYEIAKRGGIQKVALRSGNICQVKIPARIIENYEIYVPKVGLQGNDITLILHTLYDSQIRIADKIYQEIDQADFIRKDATKEKAKQTYELLEDGEYIEDIASLDLLQYLVASSKLDEPIKRRYDIAHQNCQLNIVEKAIESALAKSELSQEKKKQIRSAYQYVRASEPVPDFGYLKELEAIIASSDIPIAIKRSYSIASAKSRAFTVDIIILKLITGSAVKEKENYLLTYKEIRDGKKISHPETLPLLNSFILSSDISNSSKVIYFLAQNVFLEKDSESAKEDFGTIENVGRFVTNVGSKVVPISTGVLKALGAETATGVAISSLTGGSLSTATLAALGGGSVATGGLGMLGGLAVVTGGAALIGAAGLVSVALVSQMDGEDLKNLGIAAVTGALASAGAILIAWTAASALGIAGTLSGAAAITSLISALGGLSVITGGASFIAFGAGFVVWSFLKEQKKRDSNILHQLESRLYTLTEIPTSPKLKEFIEFLNQKLNNQYKIEGFEIAPNITLDKLSNTISSYAASVMESDEKILVLKNTGFWNDAKEGIVLTNKKVIWKSGWSAPEFIAFYAISEYRKLPELSVDEENAHFYRLMQEIGKKYDDL